MSLILLLIALTTTAFAQGSVVWLSGPPDPDAAPGRVVVPMEVVAPDGDLTEEEVAALDALRAELEAVTPLVNEFDGELMIMSRLQGALADVHVIRDERDRALVFSALLFQGYAIQRYFQDTLGMDPAASPYRTPVGGSLEVAPWVDAVAVWPDRVVTADDISEEPERLAFDEARARVLLAPKAKLRIAHLPADSELWADGQPRLVDTPGDATIDLTPGRHFFAVWRDGEVHDHGEVRLSEGVTSRHATPPTRAALDELARLLETGPDTAKLPGSLVDALARLPQPTHLAVANEPSAFVFAVEAAHAVRLADERPEPVASAPRPSPATVLRLSTGLGWLYDPNFFSTNVRDGAPHTAATVNAAAPVLGLEGQTSVSDWAVGVGLDVAVPTGSWHHLPVGDLEVRARFHPHVSVGHRAVPVRATVGALLPWHAALGVRGAIPLVEGFELTGAWVVALGVPRGRGDAPTFSPGGAHLVSVGLTTSLPMSR